MRLTKIISRPVNLTGVPGSTIGAPVTLTGVGSPQLSRLSECIGAPAKASGVLSVIVSRPAGIAGGGGEQDETSLTS